MRGTIIYEIILDRNLQILSNITYLGSLNMVYACLELFEPSTNFLDESKSNTYICQSVCLQRSCIKRRFNLLGIVWGMQTDVEIWWWPRHGWWICKILRIPSISCDNLLIFGPNMCDKTWLRCGIINVVGWSSIIETWNIVFWCYGEASSGLRQTRVELGCVGIK